MGNVTYRLTSNIKFKAGAVLNRYTTYNSDYSEGGIKGTGNDGKNIFLPMEESAAGKMRFTDQVEYIALTHALSPTTFYEARFSFSRSQEDTIDVPLLTTLNRKDEVKWFNIGRETALWNLSDRKRISFKLDLTSQITKEHQVKSGFEFKRQDRSGRII